MEYENENEHKSFYFKLEYFFEKSIAVHILKKDGRFHNGKVLELTQGMLILDDEKQGAIPIQFNEIKFLDKREEKRWDEMC